MIESTSRRRFLGVSLAATAAVSLGRCEAGGEDEPPRKGDGPIVDTNVYVSRWPFRRLPEDDADSLVKKLKARGVTQAWAGSFDGVFHKDLASVNARLAETCRASSGFLIPFGSVNPARADWKEDVRRCRVEFGMPGIRVHPAYHGYGVDDPAFERLLDEAEEHQLIVQVVAWMEDPRQQSAMMTVPGVDLTPLDGNLERRPESRLMVLNGFTTPNDQAVRALMESGRAWFDIARLDVLDGLNQLRGVARMDRIVFGSYAPMFYFESTLLKLVESGIEGEPARAILAENAQGLLAPVE